MRTAVRFQVLLAAAAIMTTALGPAVAAQGGDDAIDAERLAQFTADTHASAVEVDGLVARSVFGGDEPEEGLVVNAMNIGQKRYGIAGSAFTRGLAEMQSSGNHPPHWTIHSAGIESFFSTSVTTNIVVVTLPTGTLACARGAYSELAVFELYDATFAIAPTPVAPNDPGVGAASAYSLICRDGEESSFFGIANEAGVLDPFEVPVGIVEMELEDEDVYVFVTPRDVEVRIAQSAAPDIAVAEAAVVTAPDGRYGGEDVTDPESVPTEPGEFEEGAEGFLIVLLEVFSGFDGGGRPMSANPAQDDEVDGAAQDEEVDGATADVDGSAEEEDAGDDGPPVALIIGGLGGAAVAAVVTKKALAKKAPGKRKAATKKRAARGPKKTPGGGMTTPRPLTPIDDTPERHGPESGETTATSGGGWVELGRADVRRTAYRRAAELAEKAGVKPNENGNVVPSKEMWDEALGPIGTDPELEELRQEVESSFDEEGSRPTGVPAGSAIEVDGSTGRAFWRPPGGGSAPGSDGVAIS